MKKTLLLTALLGALTIPLFSGCVAAIGNSPAARSSATLGQQLIDLQKARDSGAITEAEYQGQRAKFLGGNK
jgi:hypothetical protein